MPGAAGAILRNFGADAPGCRAVGLDAALVLAAGGVVLGAESAQAAQQAEQYVVNGSYSDDGNTQSLTVPKFDPASAWASDYITNAPPGWTAGANLRGEVTATVTYTYDDAGGAQDPPADDPPADDPPADDPPAQDPPADNPPAQDPPAQNPPAQASGPGPRVNTGGSLMADRRPVAVGTVVAGTGPILTAGMLIAGSIRRERKSLR